MKIFALVLLTAAGISTLSASGSVINEINTPNAPKPCWPFTLQAIRVDLEKAKSILFLTEKLLSTQKQECSWKMISRWQRTKYSITSKQF